MIDIHSHFLPGIDDGARTIQEAFQMLLVAARDGTKTVILTPHLYVEAYKGNTPSAVINKYNAFQEALKGLDRNRLDVCLPEVLLGAENFVNYRFIRDLEDWEIVLTLNRTNYILLEFPLAGFFNFFDRLLSALFVRGLTPIIAHPERNLQFQREPEWVQKLVSQGALVQVDAMSLTGNFGVEARKTGFYLLERNLVHFIASDTHGINTRKPMLSKAVDIAAKFIGVERGKALVISNPSCVLSGQEIPIDQELLSKPKRRSWLHALIR